jgi:hypothetical protein
VVQHGGITAVDEVAPRGRAAAWVVGDTDVVLASLLKSKTDVLRFAMVQARGRATAV